MTLRLDAMLEAKKEAGNGGSGTILERPLPTEDVTKTLGRGWSKLKVFAWARVGWCAGVWCVGVGVSVCVPACTRARPSAA